jgi:hypothetical protein
MVHLCRWLHSPLLRPCPGQFHSASIGVGIGKRAVRSADRSPHSRPRLILDRTTPALLGGRPGSSTRRAVAALLAASVAESGGASERDRRVSYSAYWRCQPLIGAGLRSMAPTRKSFAPTEATDAVAIS